MTRFRFRIWPTIGTLLGLSVLLSLGTWQYLRYGEKTVIEARRDAGADLELAVVRSLDDVTPELDFRRLHVHGRVDPAHAFLIKHRIFEGQPGYWLVSPLVLDGGGAILVNRGWLPLDNALERATQLREAPETEFVGLLHMLDRVIEDPRFRASQSTDEVPTLESYDVTAIADALPHTLPERPVILTLDERHSGSPYPRASLEHITEPYLTAEKHLGYSVTWFTLALALIAMYVCYGLGLLSSRAMH